MEIKHEFHWVGKEISNDNAYGKVTGQAEYCGDMDSPRMLHMKLKGSTVASGMIRSIDTSRAEKMPGVKAVYTYLNTPDKLWDRGRVAAYEEAPDQERLFDFRIRFYGERVAGVVAETEEQAQAACDAIQVTYDPLPAVLTMEQAMAPDAPQLHPAGNVYETPVVDTADPSLCQGTYHFENTTHISRMNQMPMETHVARACYDKGRGRLTVWTPCQMVFGVRTNICWFLDLPYSKVRVIKSLMGGSFGCKQETLAEPLVAWAAWDLKADVKIVYTREEQVVNTMLKHNLDGHMESWINEDGTIAAMSVSLLMEAGAYQTISPSYARTIGGKLGKVYRVPYIHYDGKTVCTNTTVNGSFRSWGSCEALGIYENHFNMVARKMGMDPVDFRMKNVHEAYEVEPMHKVSVAHTHFKECLNIGRKEFDWDVKKAWCRDQSKSNKRYRYGVGMALASHTSSFYPYMADIASCLVRLQDDGSLTVNIAIHDHGCGTVMAMKKIAAEVMEIPLDHVELQEADTEYNLYDYGCYGSRTVYVLGQSVMKCCEALKERLEKLASMMLGRSAHMFRYQAGYFYPEDEPENRKSLREISNYALSVLGEDVYAAYTWNSTANPGVSASDWAQVEVDTFTGAVRVMDFLAVHDIGRAINPDLCRGQVGSGIQQGMGMALCEEIKISPETGQVLNPNLKDYEVANAVDLPDYRVIFIEEPEKDGPFGAKSIGEVAVAAVAPALVAAVNDALGTDLTHLPLTPPVILEALAKEDAHEN